MANILGLDLGFAPEGASGGAAYMTVERGQGACSIAVSAETEVLTTAEQDALAINVAGANPRTIDIITVDAPISPRLLQDIPDTGRSVERVFSRGGFSNGLRGLQPSSISVPLPGWPLYLRGMALKNLVDGSFPYLPMPQQGVAAAFQGPVLLEVIPKLTHSLLAGRTLTVFRPLTVDAYYGQIDNWLFPHLFGSRDAWNAHGWFPHLLIEDSVFEEAGRILGLEVQGERHEAVGAFVSAFQGALAAADEASLVGTHGDYEGYYLLPRIWHPEWEAEYARVEHGTVRRLPLTMTIQ